MGLLSCVPLANTCHVSFEACVRDNEVGVGNTGLQSSWGGLSLSHDHIGGVHSWVCQHPPEPGYSWMQNCCPEANDSSLFFPKSFPFNFSWLEFPRVLIFKVFLTEVGDGEFQRGFFIVPIWGCKSNLFGGSVVTERRVGNPNETLFGG